MRNPKVGDKLVIVMEDTEHPFSFEEIVKVTDVQDYGVVWAKSKDKTLGCLIPDNYAFADLYFGKQKAQQLEFDIFE